MHKTIKKRLSDARGVSEYIIALVIDIRGFSSFSKEVESPDVATYIKKTYLGIINDYFPTHSFIKLTGDGLLITTPYNEQNLEEVAHNIIKSCFDLIDEFPTICSDDPMITFDVPQKIGIGISRGTACKLISKKTILDYSGRVLNLASRLMDLARPSGIVFDANFGSNLLRDDYLKRFKETDAYLRGVAESVPVKIYFSKDYTTIPEANLRPLAKDDWQEILETFTLRKIKSVKQWFVIDLPTEPKSEEEIIVRISHAKIVGGKQSTELTSSFEYTAIRYEAKAGRYSLSIDFKGLSEIMQERGLKQTWNVTIEVFYPEK